MPKRRPASASQPLMRLNVNLPKPLYDRLYDYIKRRFVRPYGALNQVLQEALSYYLETHPPPERPTEYPKVERHRPS